MARVGRGRLRTCKKGRRTIGPARLPFKLALCADGSARVRLARPAAAQRKPAGVDPPVKSDSRKDGLSLASVSGRSRATARPRERRIHPADSSRVGHRRVGDDLDALALVLALLDIEPRALVVPDVGIGAAVAVRALPWRALGVVAGGGLVRGGCRRRSAARLGAADPLVNGRRPGRAPARPRAPGSGGLTPTRPRAPGRPGRAPTRPRAPGRPDRTPTRRGRLRGGDRTPTVRGRPGSVEPIAWASAVAPGPLELITADGWLLGVESVWAKAAGAESSAAPAAKYSNLRMQWSSYLDPVSGFRGRGNARR